MSTASPDLTTCFPHCCRASDENSPSQAVRRAAPPQAAVQGGNREVCPHDCLDLNGNVHVPIASSDGGTEGQSCRAASKGARDASGLGPQEGQHGVTQSRS